MYAISATVVKSDDNGYEGTSQVPTFYLDENVQGITDEAHAVRIATSIIRATGDFNNFVHVTAVKINSVDTYCKTHDIFSCWMNHQVPA